MPDNPNPFDFVPFKDGPLLKSPEKWQLAETTDTETTDTETTYSGYLMVELKALSPLHIVGRQEPAIPGRCIKKSHFYRQDGKPCIPGSSIRGMLRNYIETLTNGWVSKVKEEYKKNYRERHIGFRAFKDYHNEHRHRAPTIAPAAIPPTYKFDLKEKDGEVEIDAASFMFGYVSPEKKPESADTKTLPSMKSKIIIEDVFINSHLQEFNLPDVDGNAYMGGAKPSASNWWYFTPKEIWERHTAGHLIVEFVGKGYRGRKYYYHQESTEKCVNYYMDNWHPYLYKAECLPVESTAQFRIYCDRLPESFLQLLCQCLCPRENDHQIAIRHKLGFGKPFGLGSVEFNITGAKLRQDAEFGLPQELKDFKSEVDGFISATDFPGKFEIATETHLCLQKFLGWPPVVGFVFTYPKYASIYFKTPVFKADFDRYSSIAMPGNKLSVNQDNATIIAGNLWNKKKTIDFRLFQKNSGLEAILKTRTSD